MFECAESVSAVGFLRFRPRTKTPPVIIPVYDSETDDSDENGAGDEDDNNDDSDDEIEF